MTIRRIDRSSLVWGGLFIVTGASFLLQALGVWEVRADVLLPVLLIVGGLGLLFGSLAASPQEITATNARLPLDGATAARLELAYGAGTLRLTGGAAPDTLFEGTFVGGIRQEARRRTDRLDVTLGHAADAPRVLGSSGPLNWDVRLTDHVPVDLELKTGASRVDLDLADSTVRSLKIASGASDIDITLPRHGDCKVEIDAAAADVVVHVPEGVAACVRTSSALAAIKIDEERFPAVDGLHRTPGFDTASDRADIEIEGALASFAVR